MTREEAIEVLRANYPDACYSLLREEVEMAIKALSAIEKIKAEINEFIKNPGFGDLDIGASCGAVRCLEIIDRHISGKEVQ